VRRRHDGEGWQRSELSGGSALERPGEGEEERERGGMVRGSSGSFYRGRGGPWRGSWREEGVLSMAADMEADGASGKGNDETDVSKGGERNRRCFGSTSQSGRARRRGAVAAAGRRQCSASIERKEKGRMGRLGQTAARAR
jgi:hypothetical protein